MLGRIVFLLYSISVLFHKWKMKLLAEAVKKFIYFMFKMEIDYRSDCDGVIFPHPIGVVIGRGVKIGNNVKIYQNVTLGGNFGKVVNDQIYPIIGDNIVILAGAVIAGPIQICSNVVIGANSVVTRSITESGIYAGNPLQFIRPLKNWELVHMGVEKSKV